MGDYNHLSTTLVLGDLTPSPAPSEYCIHMVPLHTCRKTSIHIKIDESLKKLCFDIINKFGLYNFYLSISEVILILLQNIYFKIIIAKIFVVCLIHYTLQRVSICNTTAIILPCFSMVTAFCAGLYTPEGRTVSFLSCYLWGQKTNS